MNKAELLQN